VLVLAAATAPAYAGGDFMDVAAGSRTVWVTGPVGVVRLDARTGHVGRQYILPALYPLGVAVGGSAVWVASVENGYTSGTVTRIDTRTGSSRTVFRRDRWPAESVAVIGRTVWVGFGSRLGRFDLAGRLLGVTPLDRGGGWLAVDDGGAWFCCHGRRLLRVDPVGRRRASFTLPVADPIWTGLGSLWLDARGTLDRIDERTGRVLARIPLRSVVDVAVGPGGVYALQDGAVALIDPATNRVVARRALVGTTQAVSFEPEGVWVTSVGRSSPRERVFRLNPRTLATERTVSLY
jgi:streptogramin lyase